MDDYEHSVHVSERDWDSFFQECEECDLFPPALAGLDSSISDSSMSDIDDAGGSTFLDRRLLADLKSDAWEAVFPMDGPPDCEGSPVEHYLSKYGVGSLENVLSCSEDEDLHLESVNRFFERLKSLPESEQLIEHSQATVGKSSKVAQGEVCGDGPRANDGALPINNPELNSLSASSKAATGMETTEPDNANTTDRSDSKMAPELPVNDASEGKTDKSTNPNVELAIREEDWLLVPANEAGRQKREGKSRDLFKEILEMTADSLNTPASGKVLNSELAVCKSVGDESHGDIMLDKPLLKKSSDSCLNPDRDSSTNLEVMPYDKSTEGKYLAVTPPKKDPEQQSVRSPDQSPSFTIKKKRRRKKTVSIEPMEAGHGYKRQFFANNSDSGKERYVRGIEMDAHVRLSRDYTAVYVNEAGCEHIKSSAHQTHSSQCPPTHSEILQGRARNNVPPGPTAVEHDEVSLNLPTPPLRDRQSQTLTEKNELRLVKSEPLGTEAKCKQAKSSLPINSEGTDRSRSAPCRAVDSGLSTPNYDGNVAANLQPSSALQLQPSTEFKECPVSMSTCASSESPPVTEEGKFGSDNIAKYRRESGPLQLQEVNGKTQNRDTSSEDLNTPESTEHNTALRNNTSFTSKVSSGLIISSTLQLPAHENIVLKMHQELKNGLIPTLDKTMASEVVSTNTTLKPTKTPLPGKINSFNEPCCSKSDDVISQTTYGNQTVKSTIILDATTERPVLAMPLFTVSCYSVIPKSAMNSNQADEINDTHISNNVTEKDPDSSAPENVPLTQSNISLNGLSNSPDLQMEGSQIVGFQSNKTSMVALPDKRNTVIDLPVTLFESSDAPDIKTRFNGQEAKLSIGKATSEREREMSEHDSQDMSQDTPELKVDIEVKTEDTVTTAKTAECDGIKKAPDETRPVYAISAFWNEMEKLTINDILRLRMVSNAQQSSVLPQPPESEAADTPDAADSGYFTHLEDYKPHRSSGDMSTISDFDKEFSQHQNADNPSTDPITSDESPNSIGILWESEPDSVSVGAGIYPENVAMPSSASDIPLPIFSGSARQYLRKIRKNVSVQNLLALEVEPLCQVLKGRALPAVISEEGEPEMESCNDGHLVRQHSGMDSLPPASFSEDVSTESNQISFSEIIQYIFGGNKSEPSPSETDNMAAYYVNSDSVPEYEHFYSEFDAGSFFYPVREASGHNKDEQVPIFSCGRSANKNLQFPEAYDHFFSSDSSVDSDEDDNQDRSPIRVITRFNHKPSETQGVIVAPDIYEDFFTDEGLSENFFWKNYFSLRKVSFTGSTSQSQRSHSWSLVSVDEIKSSFRRTIRPINALGIQDKPFPDQLLYNLEGRIFRQLAEQKRRYPDLQMAAANPRLDASLVPLRQSDMCLVCIAFASWVLKSANPQAGDAWKAVLLANISALSAIRYLRRRGREEATGEKPLRQAPSI
ncbi:PGC-1 and ERR-induced regulator in muscle protein 1 [Coregonus clupeaformis]|uniref:PGC-1 and ERR-induced regulator in muscle protein 1 n=1 Tax=Coregonus clupeaformis TaxID=59861 RepID=UPI001BE024AD|nr:PGC-1 and ERR-induced regulator in muscle protein 1 [Coregonus clupeaformis]